MTNRRNFLRTAALASAPLAATTSTPYRQSGYLGWITDLDSRPDGHAPWPSMRLDDSLLSDYEASFRMMKATGYNNLVAWGLYVSRYWPVDLAKAITPERGLLVEKLIASAKAHNLRVISGLGVFSWGFEELIRAKPSLSRTNPRAMCSSSAEAWQWMERITDFVFTRFPIDGVSMQSADQGRCNCSPCSRYGDSEYHARINIRMAEYIHSRYPGKIVAVSGWGMKFEDPASLPFMKQMGEKLDYLIDVTDSTRQRERAYRRLVIRELKCDFGTLGGPQVEPPQHFARDRWFLPTVQADAEHLRDLAEDGGRACEYFYHILANPGDEVSAWVTGRVLSDVSTPWRKHFQSTLEELYLVTRPSTGDGLAELFISAEEAYLKHIRTWLSGTISLEALNENYAGPPIYLSKRLTPEARREYAADLLPVAAGFRRIAPDVPEPKRIPLILRCLENVQRDLRALGV